MSEQNILNPLPTSPLNPDYPFSVPPLPDPTEAQMLGGQMVARHTQVAGRTIPLTWSKMSQDSADALRQWHRQYRQGFFSLYHSGWGRYFSGRFVQMDIQEAGYLNWSAAATFVELPKVAMYAWPQNWSRDAIFIEETDDFFSDNVALAGTGWTRVASGSAHGGYQYISAVTNATAEWQYFGYGFRFWAEKYSDRGIAEISLDGTVLGTVDLYSSGAVTAAALLTKYDVPLGLHRVKVRVTGTKNASSSDYKCVADAIEVMQ